jgi:DNA helicase-2/ATP-dependent DNA helicase PcrA
VDFGDLIKKPVEILRNNPSAAQRIRGRFRVILVDEYQDANIAQFELLKELCDSSTYVCVVGDDDQSIYRFRGAEVRNILEFPDRFPNTDIIRLERNYRSISPILQAASSVVDHNKNRLGKTLRSERGPGKNPVLAFLPDQDEEAEYCAELILKSVKETGRKSGYSDWAILYRTNAQSLGFETEFLRRKIPYKVVGSLKFYEREEIKDALALLAFLVNPRDEVAFRRVVNKPARGLGPAAIERIIEGSINDEGNLEAAIRRIGPGLSAKARSGAAQFLKAIEMGRNALDKSDSLSNDETSVSKTPVPDGNKKTKKKPKAKKAPSQKEGLRAGEGLSLCVVHLAVESGIAEYHLSHDEVAGNQRLHNLQELANAASIYPASMAGLLDFLEHIELDRAMEENTEGNDDCVTLITLHNTKGLEFCKVIMTGVEQGVFPRDGKTPDELEEERRLFYVGATRAMDELYLCSCTMRRMYGRLEYMEPSIFLREIDKDCLRIVGSAPRGFKVSSVPSSTRSGSKKGSGKTSPSDGYWRKGDRVYHDDYGYGEVREIRNSEVGPIVRAYFENCGEIQFLSLHQGRNFTRIRD